MFRSSKALESAVEDLLLSGFDRADIDRAATLELRRGEGLITHADSGGVGTPAIQFAQRRCAKVLATAKGADGLGLVYQMGADQALDGSRQNLVGAVRRLPPDGVDAVLALAGGRELVYALATVRRGGRVTYPNGVEPVPPKRAITFTAYDGASGPRQFEQLNEAATAAKLKVPVPEHFPLIDGAKASEHLAAGHVPGNIFRIRNP